MAGSKKRVREVAAAVETCTLHQGDSCESSSMAVTTKRGAFLSGPATPAHGDEPMTPGLAALIQGSYTYYPGTQMPVEGWFQGCRGCRRRTAHSIRNRAHDEVPACRNCAEQAFREHPDVCALNLPNEHGFLQSDVTDIHKIALGVMAMHSAKHQSAKRQYASMMQEATVAEQQQQQQQPMRPHAMQCTSTGVYQPLPAHATSQQGYDTPLRCQSMDSMPHAQQASVAPPHHAAMQGETTYPMQPTNSTVLGGSMAPAQQHMSACPPDHHMPCGPHMPALFAPAKGQGGEEEACLAVVQAKASQQRANSSSTSSASSLLVYAAAHQQHHNGLMY